MLGYVEAVQRVLAALVLLRHEIHEPPDHILDRDLLGWVSSSDPFQRLNPIFVQERCRGLVTRDGSTRAAAAAAAGETSARLGCSLWLFFFFYRGLWAFSFTVLFSSPKKLIVQFTYISRDKSFLKEKKQKVQIKFKNQHESHSITFVF
jgi:hypothetical protein